MQCANVLDDDVKGGRANYGVDKFSEFEYYAAIVQYNGINE